MKWASAVSEAKELEEAMAEAIASVQDGLGGARPDLAVVFASDHHRPGFSGIPERLGAELGARILIGCSAGGVIGGGHEVEHRAGLSLTAAVLPEVELTPFYLENEQLLHDDAETGKWESLLGVSAADEPSFVLLPDPFSFDAQRFLGGLDRHFAASTKVGGLASGGQESGVNTMFLTDGTRERGLVGLAMSGNITVDTIVAQGCRPIGEPMFVTGCRGNLLLELDGRPARDVLRELFHGLPARDQQLMRNSLFLGIVMRELESEYRQGDFLIRNLMGVDPESGALAIGADLKENLVVQFHLRDAQTSAEDLEALLQRYHAEAGGAQGSLLFSCLGRGVHLYGEPDHDSAKFRERLGPVPLGGFFCNGEIGPVQGTTFLHGYTSSFGLFRSRD